MVSTDTLVGIIGGSGLCKFPEITDSKRIKVNTKYGSPSDEIILGKIGDSAVAFIPRHGSEHTIPPHRIPYKANIEALKSLGAKTILATCIAGSLKSEIAPGHFVIPDQFINFTWGRDDTFDQDGIVMHTPMAYPYCEQVSRVAQKEAQALGIESHFGGTAVVIQGPRFSTLAESSFFIDNGWDIVNMTQYPECFFARELGVCYSAIAMITDYDPGVRKSLQMNRSCMDEVLPIFHRNIVLGKELLIKTVESLSDRGGPTCDCATTYLEYYKQ